MSNIKTQTSTIDKHWADGVGVALRPSDPSDQMKDFVFQNTTILHVSNDKSLYISLGSEFQYLRDKGYKAFADKSKYPSGKGIWFRSVRLENITIDGVERRDNAKTQGAHTDGLYIGSDPAVNALGAKTDVHVKNLTLRNCDGSCMAVLIQNPARIGNLIFDSLHIEPTVIQKRLVIKIGTFIDRLTFINTTSFSVTPDTDEFHIGEIHLINSSIDLRMLAKKKIPTFYS